jgi:NADPH-dependent 2,4-dienoyl-CoA reductase/sulfur reductase-like enzyme
MHIVGRYGALHHTVKRPRLHQAIRKSITSTPLLRYAHQLIPPIELNANPNPKAHDIAVLGGGITGLTTAYHLQRTIPYANITIYDQQERLGGWLDSDVIKVDGGEVLFEWGARSLRPDMNGPGLATIMLVCNKQGAS